jgi:hypothetical protein
VITHSLIERAPDVGALLWQPPLRAPVRAELRVLPGHQINVEGTLYGAGQTFTAVARSTTALRTIRGWIARGFAEEAT